MIEKAITYFEDAIHETDEIIADCSKRLQKELTEQKGYFEVALTAMRQVQANNHINCRICNYQTTTKEQRDELGCDPCLDCRDSSNWKPKED